MGVALYAMFIAILVPGVKKSLLNGIVAVAGGLIAWGASLAVPGLSSGWRIIVAILVSSAIGAAIGGEKETP
jgi:predicted branched-subunit amino acid permease